MRRPLPLLVGGQLINGIGSFVAFTALWGFGAFEFDVGAGAIAALFWVWAVAGAILVPVVGVPIDRFGPRRTLVAANLIGAAAAVVLTQADHFWQIVVLAFPLGLADGTAAAAADTLPPRLVADDRLPAANGWLGSAESTGIIVGPPLAALTVETFGFAAAFWLDAVTYLVAAAAVWALPHTPAREDEVPAGLREVAGELREGLGVVRRTSPARRLFLLAITIYCAWGAFIVVEPVFVRDVLGRSETVLAWLQTAYGLGTVVAAAAVVRWGARWVRMSTVHAAGVASGLGACLYVGTSSTTVAFVGVAAWGLAIGAWMPAQRTLLQRSIDSAFHGRVLALARSLESWTFLVVLPVVGPIGAAAGPQALGIGAGVTCALVALLLAVRSAAAEGDDPTPPEGVAQESWTTDSSPTTRSTPRSPASTGGSATATTSTASSGSTTSSGPSAS